MTSEWKKLILKVSEIHNVSYGDKLLTVYLVTLDGNYLATVRGDRYVEMIIKDVQGLNPDKEVIIVRI